MDITSMLQFGPKKTFAPADEAPSIYADPSAWQAYHANRNITALLEANANATAQNKVIPTQVEQQLLQEVGDDPESLQREINSLLSRFPSTSVLSPQASPAEALPPGKTEDKPVIPTSANPQHAKQDLINKNWGSSGVKAFTDANGQLVLTNNPEATDAKSAMRPFGRDAIGGNNSNANFVPVGSNSTTGNAVRLMQQLRSASDLSEAQGIYYSMQTALTEQTAQMQTQAITFAEQKVGLPAMRRELENAIAADRADVRYVPGMGDSPITAKIRQQVTGLEDQAQQEAERWLGRNVAFAQIKNTAASAKSEMDRFSRMEDWKQQRQATREASAEEWDRRKKETTELQAAQIPAETKQRILKLHPEIANQENPDVAIFNQAKQLEKTGGNDFKVAINAPEHSLPALAVAGNQFAKDIVVQDEAARTGESAEAIRGRMDILNSYTKDPKFAQKFYEAVTPQGGDRQKAIKDSIAAYNAKAMDKTAKGSADFREMQANMALQFAALTATERFVGDLSKLQTTNAKLGDAVRLSLKNTGSASLENVVAAWAGNATGQEALSSYNALIGVLQTESLKYKGSIFGEPNMVAIRAAINEMARSKFSALGTVKRFIGNAGGLIPAEGSFARDVWGSIIDPTSGPRKLMQGTANSIDTFVNGPKNVLGE